LSFEDLPIVVVWGLNLRQGNLIRIRIFGELEISGFNYIFGNREQRYFTILLDRGYISNEVSSFRTEIELGKTFSAHGHGRFSRRQKKSSSELPKSFKSSYTTTISTMAPESNKRKAPTSASNLANSRKRAKLQKEKAKAKAAGAGAADGAEPKTKKDLPKKDQFKKEFPKKDQFKKGDQKQQKPAKATSTAEQIPKPPTTEPRPVSLDELSWHEVAVPDQLDDYEGFFGLEEVENIEVVRHANSGKVTFKTAVVDGANEDKSNGVTDTYAAIKKALKATGNGAAVLEDEWAGFSDADPADEEEKEKEQKPEKLSKKAKKSAAKKVEKAPAPTQFGSIPFAGLLDEDLDEGIDTSEWEPLGLAPETLSALSTMRFARPTPIQSAAIPEIMAGHDVVGKASTGSGKTLAFGIPILERFLQNPIPGDSDEKEETIPLALILAPTRELAHQIGKHLTILCNQEAFSGPRIAIITGGLSIQKQQRQLVTADIIVGTPGRLWEVMGGGHGIINKLRQIQFLVVDEADRLLSEGSFKEVEEILNALDREEKDEDAEDESEEVEEKERQTLVFSATFHKGLQQKLAGKSRPSGDLMTKQESMEYLLKKLHFREEKPKFIDVNPDSQMASRLKEGLVECAGTEKVGIPYLSTFTFSDNGIGSLSLFPSNASPQNTYVGVHKLNFRRPPYHAFPPISGPARTGTALQHGAKSTPARHRTLYSL
jgi:hypothetical protein